MTAIEERSFYLRLCSDDCHDIDKSRYAFAVCVEPPMRLRGKYAVALTEMYIYRFVSNMQAGMLQYRTRSTAAAQYSPWVSYRLSPGLYTVQDGFDEIASQVRPLSLSGTRQKKRDKVSSRYNQIIDRVQITPFNNSEIRFRGDLAVLFGYTDGQVLRAPQPTRAGRPPMPFGTRPCVDVHCNIVEGRQIGSSRARILSTVDIASASGPIRGLYHRCIIDRPSYVRVMNEYEILNIEFVIKPSDGGIVLPDGKYNKGVMPTVIVLHFMKTD